MTREDTLFQAAANILKHHGTEPGLLVTPEHFADWTPKQKSIALAFELMSGKLFNPIQFSSEMNIDRRIIYRYLRDIAAMGIPVVRVKRGQWTLRYFLQEEDAVL